MTNTIKRPHRFVVAGKLKGIFCQYCGFKVSFEDDDDEATKSYEYSSQGCPCAPIQQEEEGCRTCKGEGKLKLGWEGKPHGYTEKCADCNGAGEN